MPDAFGLASGSQMIHGVGTEGHSAGSTFVVTQVSHPSGFRRWDYELAIGPEFVADVFENDVRLAPESVPIPPDAPRLRYRRFGGGIGGNFDAHTPIGAFGVGVVLGGIAVHASEPDATEFSVTAGVRLRYTVFFSEKFFGQIIHSTDRLAVELGDFESSHTVSNRVQIGVYLPEIEGWVRSWF